MAVLGSSGGGHLPQLTITYSGNWSPPIAGNVCFHLVGAGGGGSSQSGNGAGGGGAGGYCKKNSLAVVTTDVFAIVVGLGGLAGYNANSGSAGGNTTVTQSTGSGLSAVLTANGGAGGTSSAGGAGGTAANGDVNNTGGAGSTHTSNDGSTGCGGSVGIYGTGNAGNQYVVPQSTGYYSPSGTRTDSAGGGLAMSGYGQIVGGTHGGIAPWGLAADGQAGRLDGDDLCGGGRGYTSAATYIFAGNGGIGGGGGSSRYASDSGYTWGGHGGDGIVLIQYLP